MEERGRCLMLIHLNRDLTPIYSVVYAHFPSMPCHTIGCGDMLPWQQTKSRWRNELAVGLTIGTDWIA